jgi:hypothetical protein
MLNPHLRHGEANECRSFGDLKAYSSGFPRRGLTGENRAGNSGKQDVMASILCRRELTWSEGRARRWRGRLTPRSVRKTAPVQGKIADLRRHGIGMD